MLDEIDSVIKNSALRQRAEKAEAEVERMREDYKTACAGRAAFAEERNAALAEVEKLRALCWSNGVCPVCGAKADAYNNNTFCTDCGSKQYDGGEL